LPLEEPPKLLVRRSHVGNAEVMSWVEDIRPWGGAARFGLATDLIKFVCDVVRELKPKSKTVGMELGDLMRINATQIQLDALRSSLPMAKIVDASELIWQLRQVKSYAEIDCLKKAGDITVKALEEGLRAVRVGISERELARIIYMKMLEQGSEDSPLELFMHVRGGPKRYRQEDPRPTHKKLERGDIVIFDGGTNENGYWTDIIRLACVGEPTQKQKEMFDACLKANVAAISELRAGQKISKPYDAANKVFEEKGFPKVGGRIGHGVGLDIHEPPSLGPPNLETVMKPNMVFAVEPTIVDEPIYHGRTGEGIFMVEDNVLVTSKGPEILTPLKKDLWIA
jgi:Xaa-Pro aminopeptidase